MTNNGDNNSHSSPFNGGAQWWLDLCKDFAWQPVRQVHPIDLREDADAIAALEQQMQRSQREARDRIALLRTDLAEKQSLLRAIGERQVVERRAAAQKQAKHTQAGICACVGVRLHQPELLPQPAPPIAMRRQIPLPFKNGHRCIRSTNRDMYEQPHHQTGFFRR